MSRLAIVIPARFQSTRLPGKPLQLIGGLPMVVHTAQSAARANPDQLIVATDDQAVLDAVVAAGYEAQLTRPDHPSGTDRVLEVADAHAWSDDTVVINVQGDEPLVPAAVISQLYAAMREQDAAIATVCEPLTRWESVFDPNTVKVVRDAADRAIYFSRAPIPYARTALSTQPQPTGAIPEDLRYFKHIGIYGYRLSALRQFVALGASSLEQTELLEQLRLLEAGVEMLVVEACAPVPGGVDTPEDLARVRALLAE